MINKLHLKQIALLALAGTYCATASSQDAELAPAPTPKAVDSVEVPTGASTEERSEDSSAQQETRNNRFVEEIIVTAQKREENLQDVPISVQAFSGDALAARGIEEPKALQLAVPGMQYNVIAGYSIIFIRGVGTDAFIPSADASVATYIDNVYFPFAQSLASTLGEVERVEVLKGPQGTLFGRNSTAGAINIITKQPGPEARTSIISSYESFGKTNLRVFTNIPLTDELAFSVSALRNKEDGYYKNYQSPRTDLPPEIARAFSAKMAWTPVEDLTALLGYSYLKTTGTTSVLFPAYDPKPLGLATGVAQAPAYKTSTDAPTYINTDTRVTTLDVKYTTPWFDTRLIGAKQDISSPTLVDFDGSSQPLVSFEAQRQFAKVKTGELQVLSNGDSWGGDWLNWIAGLYYIESEAGFDPLVFNVAPNVYNYILNPPAGGPLSALNLGQLASALDGQLAVLSQRSGIPVQQLLDRVANYGVALSLNGLLNTESTAAFFQTTAHLNDWVALTLGGRYQTETRKQTKSNTDIAPLPGAPAITLIPFALKSKDSSNFSPKAVLDFSLSDDDMIYLSYSKGFKSGTYNTIAIYSPSEYIKPEEVTSYEVGYKGTLLDGSMRFNAAAFVNEIENLQVQTVSIAAGGVTKFETAGAARIRGADFDLTWQVAPDALPGLAFTAGGAFLDGEYTDYKDGSGFDEVTGLYFDGTIFPSRDFTGNKIVRTPRFSGNTGLSYTFDFTASSLEIAGDAYYNRGSYFTAQNTKTAEQAPYKVYNARVSYFYEPWDLRLTGFCRNLSDTEYFYLISEFDFTTAKLLAPPRTFGVQVQWAF